MASHIFDCTHNNIMSDTFMLWLPISCLHKLSLLAMLAIMILGVLIYMYMYGTTCTYHIGLQLVPWTQCGHYFQRTKLLLPLWQSGSYNGAGWWAQVHFVSCYDITIAKQYQLCYGDHYLIWWLPPTSAWIQLPCPHKSPLWWLTAYCMWWNRSQLQIYASPV